MRGLIALAALTWAAGAQAHAFGQSYVLPVPFSLYAWASVAALLLSFVVAAGLLRPGTASATGTGKTWRLPAWLVTSSRLLALAALLLTLATGFLGPRDPYLNAAMTLFWILFVLGVTYASALLGDLFTAISPWRLLVAGLRRITRRDTSLPLDEGVNRWLPALLYGVFIGIELFADLGPRGLAAMLTTYTLAIVLAGWWLGPAWLARVELFEVILGWLGRCAPCQLVPQRHSLQLRLSWPLQGLLARPADHVGEGLLILCLLAATAYDGLHMTEVWGRLSWQLLQALLGPWLGDDIVTAWPVLKQAHRVWSLLTLALAPLLYALACLAALHLARRLAGSTLSLGELARRFAPSLLPIVLVYHASHYYTLLLTQGPQVGWLLADPFGLGWRLLPAERLPVTALLPAMGTVWHTQVGLIVAGHVASVWLAHHEALRCFGSVRAAWLSQLPMLVLMMAMTVSGLWILAQPISATG